jgi:tetratricopeptide (TPR) repeat protein
MKTPSKLVMALCSTGFLFGCASNSTNAAFGSPDPISATLKSIIDTAQSLYNRGRELHRESRLAEAEQQYQQALRLDPSHMDAQNALAALDASRGDLDRAIRLLSNLADVHPEAAHVQSNLGYAYYLKGQYSQARESLERATILDPSNENAWSKLNMVISEMNRQEMLAHRVVAEAPLADNEDAMVIKAVMPGVYTMRYPDEHMPVLTSVSEPLLEQRALALAPANMSPSRSGRGELSPAGHVELVNGNGVTGLARALRGLITDKQWKVVRTRNNDQFSVKLTRIEYAASYYPAARNLADTIGVDAVLRPNDHQEGSNLRVVLGHDFKSVEPLRQRLAGTPALTGN